MKIASLLLLLTLVLSNLSAQSAKEEVDFMQSVFGMEKKALVAEFVKHPVLLRKMLSGNCMMNMKWPEKN